MQRLAQCREQELEASPMIRADPGDQRDRPESVSRKVEHRQFGAQARLAFSRCHRRVSEQRESLAGTGCLKQTQLEPGQRQLRGVRVDEMHMRDVADAGHQRRRASARRHHRNPGALAHGTHDIQVEVCVLADLCECHGRRLAVSSQDPPIPSTSFIPPTRPTRRKCMHSEPRQGIGTCKVPICDILLGQLSIQNLKYYRTAFWRYAVIGSKHRDGGQGASIPTWSWRIASNSSSKKNRSSPNAGFS